MTANRTLTTLPTWINDDTTAPTPPPTYGPQFHRQSDLQATAGDELGNLESVDVNLVNTITPWREDPKLTAHFHPDFPDDIQVVVHDGGLRTTDKHPELVWVRVMNGCAPWYSGTVLNQPTQLLTVHQGSTIYFVAPQGG